MSLTEKFKIVIVESSAIIQHGLAEILKSGLAEIEVIHCYCARDLTSCAETEDAFLILINSSITADASAVLEHSFPQAKLIGIVTNCFQREQGNLFEDLIYLTDSVENIIGIIQKHLYPTTHKMKLSGAKLTSRELNVLGLLIKGYSNKQISAELHISIHTVVTHRKNITSKLGIKSIAGLTIYGAIHNIIDIEDYLAQ
jgi:DNA-binding NarL/FixJ family response regulator